MPRRILSAVVATALAIGAVPSSTAKEKGTGSVPPAGARIAGKVLAADGKTAIAGAVVRAVPLKGGDPAVSPPSNAKGEFALERLNFGYYDLIVESPGGSFVANQVVNVPPNGKVAVQFSLVPYADKSPGWWAGREPRTLPDGGTATGSAELRLSRRGAEFWRTPAGVAVLAGIGGAVLLAIASGGGGSSSTVSASTP